MLEVIVLPGVLVVSPQFEIQFFVPGQPETVYINNEAPSLLFMPSIFFQTRTPQIKRTCLVLFILLLTLKACFTVISPLFGH